MQIKTTVKYHFTPINMATSKSQIIINVGKDLEKLEFSYTSGENVKWYSHFGKQSGHSSTIEHRVTILPTNIMP